MKNVICDSNFSFLGISFFDMGKCFFCVNGIFLDEKERGFGEII